VDAEGEAVVGQALAAVPIWILDFIGESGVRASPSLPARVAEVGMGPEVVTSGNRRRGGSRAPCLGPWAAVFLPAWWACGGVGGGGSEAAHAGSPAPRQHGTDRTLDGPLTPGGMVRLKPHMGLVLLGYDRTQQFQFRLVAGVMPWLGWSGPSLPYQRRSEKNFACPRNPGAGRSVWVYKSPERWRAEG
jgi:hypothetical protein